MTHPPYQPRAWASRLNWELTMFCTFHLSPPFPLFSIHLCPHQLALNLVPLPLPLSFLTFPPIFFLCLSGLQSSATATTLHAAFCLLLLEKWKKQVCRLMAVTSNDDLSPWACMLDQILLSKEEKVQASQPAWLWGRTSHHCHGVGYTFLLLLRRRDATFFQGGEGEVVQPAQWWYQWQPVCQAN